MSIRLVTRARVLCTRAVLVAAFVFVGPVSLAHAAGDTVTGVGGSTPTTYPESVVTGDTFSVNASSTGSGANPTGAAELSAWFHDLPGVIVSGTVVCLAAHGSQAVVGVLVTNRDDGNPFDEPPFVGDVVFVYAEDGGSSGPDYLGSAVTSLRTKNRSAGPCHYRWRAQPSLRW